MGGHAGWRASMQHEKEGCGAWSILPLKKTKCEAAVPRRPTKTKRQTVFSAKCQAAGGETQRFKRKMRSTCNAERIRTHAAIRRHDAGMDMLRCFSQGQRQRRERAQEKRTSGRFSVQRSCRRQVKTRFRDGEGGSPGEDHSSLQIRNEEWTDPNGTDPAPHPADRPPGR